VCVRCPQRHGWAAGGSRKAPAVTRWRGRPGTTERPRIPGLTPSIILSPRPGASTQIRLGAQARTTALSSLPEVAHDLTLAVVLGRQIMRRSLSASRSFLLAFGCGRSTHDPDHGPTLGRQPTEQQLGPKTKPER
jgi:hypothetical protein